MVRFSVFEAYGMCRTTAAGSTHFAVFVYAGIGSLGYGQFGIGDDAAETAAYAALCDKCFG